MNIRSKKLFAFGCTALMLVSACIVMNDEQVEEDDGFAITGTTIAFLVAGLIVGGIAGWGIAQLTNNTGTDSEMRAEDAKLIAEGLSIGLSGYANALSNYENIWKLTKEHWIRQAELATSATWKSGAEWDVDAILEKSSVYTNSSMMMANAVAQLNTHLTEIGSHVSKWNSSSTYSNGKMTIQIDYGSNRISITSSDAFKMTFGTVAEPTSNTQQVIYTGGNIYADKTTNIIYTGVDGSGNTISGTYHIDAGDVFSAGEPDGFGYRVLTLQDGVTYFGNLLPMRGLNTAPVSAAIDIQKNDSHTILYGTEFVKSSTSSYSVKLTDNGSNTYSDLSFSIIPQGANAPDSVDFMKTFTEYANVMNTVIAIMQEAQASASACWDIFDTAGESSAFVTTLTVPETYNEVSLTKSQREIVTILAMQQLADYSKNHSFDKDNIEMTMDAMSLFCRGSIKLPGTDGSLITAYEDVIFTPLFYNDMALTKGENQVSNYGFVAIWGTGQDLSDFTLTNLTDCDIQYLQTNGVLDITQMYYGGRTVNSISLTSEKVEFISSNPIDIDDPEEPSDSSMAQAIMIIMAAIGAALILIGVTRGEPLALVIGIVFVVIGVFFNGTIAEWINKLLDLLNFGSMFG